MALEFRPGVTLVIPTIPPRRNLLQRALVSTFTQTVPFTDVIIAVDHKHEGAAATRSRGLASVHTEWVAFLDDDDELRPEHLATLTAAMVSGADLYYPWFDVIGGGDPFPMFEGKEFDPLMPNMFPITVIARTALLNEAGGFTKTTVATSTVEGEDWEMWKRVIGLGGRIEHVPARTWWWYHDTGNTSGKGSQW